jgi:translation initiation factor 1 (eIF-1/SUI1)
MTTPTYTIKIHVSDNVGTYTAISGINNEYDHKKLAKVLKGICKAAKYRLIENVDTTKILLVGDHSVKITECLDTWGF